VNGDSLKTHSVSMLEENDGEVKGDGTGGGWEGVCVNNVKQAFDLREYV
jgi:hypothetical protein